MDKKYKKSFDAIDDALLEAIDWSLEAGGSTKIYDNALKELDKLRKGMKLKKVL